MGGGRTQEEGGRMVESGCLEHDAMALAHGGRCGSLIFPAWWASVGAPTVGPAGPVASPLLRYSSRCCISRSRAATAVLTPDSSTSREEQQDDEGGAAEEDMEAGCEGEERGGTATSGDAHRRLGRRVTGMRQGTGTEDEAVPVCLGAWEERAGDTERQFVHPATTQHTPHDTQRHTRTVRNRRINRVCARDAALARAQ
jgi:hypothetical protein